MVFWGLGVGVGGGVWEQVRGDEGVWKTLTKV